MKFTRTSRFRKSYRKLTTEQQSAITEALRNFAKSPHYPFPAHLNVHKLGGQKGTPIGGGSPPPVWEMHATDLLIITFQYGEKDEVIFRNCGKHAAVLRNP